MITGVVKTEASYRAVIMDSSSSLKDFLMDRKKYYRKYILGEKVEEKDNAAANMGRIVETLLMEPELFDEKFYMSACASSPTGLMLEFVEALYRHTKNATNEDGEVTRTFEEISRDAYIESGFKIKYEAVISKFVGSDAEIFYNEIRQVRAKDLTVITTQDVTNAQKIVDELKTNFVTKDIINLVRSVRYDVHNQLQVEGYMLDGHLFKSMMDKVIVDHNERTIQVYDLKCTWSVENFYEEYYLYRRAYIQAFLYWKAAVSLTKDAESDLYGYDVPPPKFIVCDSTNYYNPLIYSLSHDDLADCLLGFEHKGKTYKGVKELIEDLKWAIDNDTWNISRQNFINNGVVNIKG